MEEFRASDCRALNLELPNINQLRRLAILRMSEEKALKPPPRSQGKEKTLQDLPGAPKVAG